MATECRSYVISVKQSMLSSMCTYTRARARTGEGARGTFPLSKQMAMSRMMSMRRRRRGGGRDGARRPEPLAQGIRLWVSQAAAAAARGVSICDIQPYGRRRRRQLKPSGRESTITTPPAAERRASTDRHTRGAHRG